MTAKAGCTSERKKDTFLFLLSFLDLGEGRGNFFVSPLPFHPSRKKITHTQAATKPWREPKALAQLHHRSVFYGLPWHLSAKRKLHMHTPQPTQTLQMEAWGTWHYPQQHHLKISTILLSIDPAASENCKTWLLQTLLCPKNSWLSAGDWEGRNTGPDRVQKRLRGSCWTVRGMWGLEAKTMGLQDCTNKATASR